MKYRKRLPFGSLAVTGCSLVFVSLMLPACGADTDGVFQTSTGRDSSSSSGGGSGGSSSGGGQGGNTSSGGQGGSTSTGGQGGQAGSMSTGGQGGMGGQAGAGGQTTSSSSSSGMGPSEDCLDGLDNDMDGDIDCADKDCTPGFSCVDAPPNGWTSVSLEQGMGAPPNPMPCADGSMPESLFTGPAGPPECSACTCGDLKGTTCNAPQLLCFPGSQGCNNNQQDWTNNFNNSMCIKPGIGIGTFSMSCRLGTAASVNQAGTCAPSMSDFANKDMWTGWTQSCPVTSSAGGCATGTVCIAKPSPMQSVCLRQDGQKTCPAGYKIVEAYSGGKDDRSCGACSCTANATCTGGSYGVYDANNCPAADTPVAITSTTCQNVSAEIDFGTWSITKVPPMAAGSCAPAGGDPNGSVQPENPVTYCCK